MLISSAYAQTAAPAQSLGAGFASFLPIILMFVVMYFLMIRPQMKRQKEQKAMLAALAKGDEVATVGGVLGTISKVTETHITLEIAQNTEIIIQKNAVSSLLPKGSMKAL